MGKLSNAALRLTTGALVLDASISLPGMRHRFSFPELHDRCAILRNQMLSKARSRMLPGLPVHVDTPDATHH